VGRRSPVTPRVGLVASVRRHWSRLSAPSASSRSPRRPRSREQRHFPLASSLSRSSFSPRRRHYFDELACSRLGTSGRATPLNASPASPLHRRRVGCSCRASVSPHFPLRRGLTSPELCRGHRCRGQGSVVHHSFSFLSQKLR